MFKKIAQAQKEEKHKNNIKDIAVVNYNFIENLLENHINIITFIISGMNSKVDFVRKNEKRNIPYFYFVKDDYKKQLIDMQATVWNAQILEKEINEKLVLAMLDNMVFETIKHSGTSKGITVEIYKSDEYNQVEQQLIDLITKTNRHLLEQILQFLQCLNVEYLNELKENN